MLKELLLTISIWIVVLPAVAGFINYKGLNRDSRWIFLLVCVAVVPQLLTAALSKQNPLLNISYNLYTVIEFFILYILFRDKLQQRTHRLISNISAIVYLVVFPVMFITYGISTVFLNLLVCAGNLIYMIWILLFLKEQYQAEDSIVQHRSPFAWYLWGLIIYAPCTTIVFALYHYMRDPENELLKNLWIIHSVCNITLYILFTLGLLVRGQNDGPALRHRTV